jgi:hypothetical protein
MWKSCALVNGQADHDRILRYNVGNGAILPWNHPSSDSHGSVSIRKDEIFCHWMSDNDRGEIGNLDKSSGQTLHPENILLIGASMMLQYKSRVGSDRTIFKRNYGSRFGSPSLHLHFDCPLLPPFSFYLNKMPLKPKTSRRETTYDERRDV